MKGSDKGPQAIIDASAAIEWYDIESDNEPCKAGIYTTDPIRHNGSPETLAPLVHARVTQSLETNSIPVVLGGEHSVSIGAIDAAADVFTDLTVLQIDAHGDTRNEYQGSTHNHACVMARAMERAQTLHVGIRSLDASERGALAPERTAYAHEIVEDSSRTWVDRITSHLTAHTYVTFDLDAFDPSLLPATGTPEPGGMSWTDAVKLIDAVARHTRLIGFDIVELCPQPGMHASAFIAAKLAYRIMAAIESA